MSQAPTHHELFALCPSDPKQARSANRWCRFPPRKGGMGIAFAAAPSTKLRLVRPPPFHGGGSLAAGLGRRSDTRVVLSSPYLELEGTFESYIASRSRNTRKQLNRRMRQLSEIGDVEMSVHRTAEGGFLDDFLTETIPFLTTVHGLR